MSLIDDIDASTDRKEIANIGQAIVRNRRRVERRTRNRITIIGADNGIYTEEITERTDT